MISRGLAHVRGRIAAGLLILLPLLITLWLIRVLFDLVHENVTPWIFVALRAAGASGLERWQARIAVPLVGILLTFAIVYLVGLLAGNLLGRRALHLAEGAILKIPLVKGIYGAARQLLDAFRLTGQKPFSRVVLVEFPRPRSFAVGFVAQETNHRLGISREPCVSVFVPTAPNPTSGWVLFVPRAEVVDLDLSVEQGLKLIVSGGIMSPGDLGLLARFPGEEAGART